MLQRWHGPSAHRTVPTGKPRVGEDNPGQPWPLARSGQGRSVLRKLHSKRHIGKAWNLFWVGFLVQPEAVVGVQPPTLS